MAAIPSRTPTATRPGGAATDDGRRTTDDGRRRGFTLVELLVVIIVLGILMALLLPAIMGGLRAGRRAAVSAEINQMAQALAQFNSQYGGYPPSRVILMENGNYAALFGSTSPMSQYDPNRSPPGDIQVGLLASRTISALRKFWPKVQLSTTGNPPNVANGYINGTYNYYYDFNGNGVCDQSPYVLQGHECLVFFLGGIPLADPNTGTFSMTGFGQDPTNPFTNMVNNSNPMYNANRQPSLFEFSPGRLFADTSNVSLAGANPGVPGYYDSLNNGPPTGIGGGAGTINFYAYFNAYGNGNYDPNDVNFLETDDALQGPIELQYYVNFPTAAGTATTGSGGTTYLAVSPSPNPYTSTTTAPTVTGTVTYQSPQTFQIISAGIDGLYGVGGQFSAPSQSSTIALPFDPVNTYNGGTAAVEKDNNIRQREADNLTNFKSGTLQ